MLDLKPLKKVRFGKEVISGVCAGIAYSTGVNVFIIRLLIFCCIFSPLSFSTAIIAYLVAGICLPEWDTIPEDYEERVESW